MLKFFGQHKLLTIISVAVIALAGIGIVSYELIKHVDDELEDTAVVKDSVEIKDEENIASGIEVPQFKRVVISSESVEKDITIFISDTDDANIEGTNFSVKLIAPKEKEALAPYIEAINQINQDIAKCQDGSKKTSDVTKVKIVNDDGSVESAETKASTIEQLYIDKEVAIQAYGIALSGLDGEVLVDDDANGVIENKEMTPGEYVACLLYDENWDINYDPEEYTTDVEVKDKLETKIVVNIKKKIKKDDSSEDGQKKAATEVEAQLKDTVAFVESSDKVTEKIESTDKVKLGSSSQTLSASKTSSDDAASCSHTATKNYFTVTIAVTILDEEGQESSYSTKEEKVEAGKEYTVNVPSVEGYVIDSADYTDGTKIKIDGPTTINFKFRPAPKTAYRAGVQYSKYAGAQADEEVSGSAKITSSFDSGKFAIKVSTEGDAKLSSLTVNGNAISFENNSASFLVTEEGNYRISAGITYSDGTSDEIYNEWAVTGNGTDSSQELTDEAGNKLYVDKDCSRAATLADYEAGTKTFYYKSQSHKYTGFQAINGVTYYFDADGNKITGTQVISGVTYNFGPDGGLLVSGTGIDVSKYQGNIDWAKAKSAVSFAIIRCGYRGMKDGELHEDPYFYTNMKNAKSNGVATGVYIYSTALNEAEAVEEASMAVEMAKAAGGCAYPIYIDMEDSVRGVNKLSNEERTAIINAFCATVQSAGLKTGVYANKTWLSQKINTSSLSGNIQVWVAQYNTSCTYTGRYTMWQYSSKGSIPGISGNVDVNKSYF